ncbi:MAG: peptidylprolyl isomerase [Prevotellaceae bacterium]|jgi:peptidyl-prolyl cis-trans isomerase SurA|nr:peptidylprolyl isomerase [Prevotellaceae bacterium]
MYKKLILSMLLLLAARSSFSGPSVLDEVAAVVGNEVILGSDLEQEILQQKAQGRLDDEQLRCEVFEQLLIQKLLLAQARLDSLQVNDMAVTQEVDHRIRFFTTQLGGAPEVEKYFGKPMYQIREDLKVYVTEKNLTQQMQQKIVKDVYVTPNDVTVFYRSQAADSLPIIPEQFVIQQIARYPPSGSEARFQVREKLLELRERVLNGEKFATLAILYSEDPGSAKRGGELGLRSRDELVKQFSDVAFSLKPGQVSQIVETEFGFHVIQLIEKKGDQANLRHILMKPKFSSETQRRATQLLDSVAMFIRADSFSFERAALRFSEDKATRLNGGYVVNQQAQATRFDKDQLAPTDYFVLRNMKVGDVSAPFEAKDLTGNDIFKIIKLKQLIPSHRANMEHDYGTIHDMAKQKQQEEVFEKWLKDRIQSAIIIISNPAMASCKYEHEGWVK